MQPSLTLTDKFWPRVLSFLAGLGMAVASALTIQHYFAANFPSSLFEGSFCDINTLFNCDSSAYSPIAQIQGVPLGYFGALAGALVCLGALFPSAAFERTNKTLALLSAVGVVALFLYSVLVQRSLCLLCAGYWVFALASFALFWKYGIDSDRNGVFSGWLTPSLKHLLTFAVMAGVGAYGFSVFSNAKRDAQSGGVAAQVVAEFFNLPEVHLPSVVSPFMAVQGTERFEDAPVRIVEYGDFLCPDCRYLFEQLQRLEKEFYGKVNVAFQFFPLEARCNAVVDKDLHPGACELAYIAAYDRSKFREIHDEIFMNQKSAKDPEWRRELARRYGVEAALEDPATKDLVHRLMNTGTEYEKTSDRYAHGIRSTPTLIINNRLIIGTYPYPQLRAIFKALVEAQERALPAPEEKFLEHWVVWP